MVCLASTCCMIEGRAKSATDDVGNHVFNDRTMIEPDPEIAPSAVPPLTTVPDAALRPVMAGVHLLFVPDPDQPHWLLWGSEAAHSPLAVLGRTRHAGHPG